jgi:hypothetical protein
MDDLTPQSIVDRFLRLPANDRVEFAKLLGKEMPAELANVMFGAMETIEFNRLVSMLVDDMWRSILPSMVNAAIRIAREAPDLDGPPLEAAVFRFHQHEMEMMRRDLVAAEAAEFKHKRNRKSSPDTVRRNIEICDLRKDNPKHWSHGRLAKKFDVTDRMIRSVLKQEQKWRRLAIQMRIN